MRRFHRPVDLRFSLRISRLSAFLVLTFLGACGSSDGNGSRTPAFSSGGESEDSSPALNEHAAPGASVQEHLPPPGEGWVIFGADTVRAEIARTPEEREQGLMYREELEPGRGMLFLFQDAQYRSFWMKNTFIALDIAYLDENLRIVDIQQMEPETEEGHPSSQPAMFALEVPKGWFAAQGIQAGDQARLVFGPGG